MAHSQSALTTPHPARPYRWSPLAAAVAVAVATGSLGLDRARVAGVDSAITLISQLLMVISWKSPSAMVVPLGIPYRTDRQAGTASYGEVVRKYFGQAAETGGSPQITRRRVARVGVGRA